MLFQKNTGQAILQNIHVPYGTSSLSTTDVDEKYEYTVQSHTSNRKLWNKGSIKRKMMENSGLDYVLPTQHLLSKWKEDILQRESLTRNLQIGRAMEVVLIGCSVTVSLRSLNFSLYKILYKIISNNFNFTTLLVSKDAFLQDDDFFSFVNNGGSISVINSQFGRNEVTVRIFVKHVGSLIIFVSTFFH